MNLNNLILLFKQQYSINDLTQEISKEVKCYAFDLITGKSSVVVESNSNKEYNYTNSDILILLNYYKQHLLGEWELDYIFNCIEFSEEWQGENKAENVVFWLANPEVNFPINAHNIDLCIKYLGNIIMDVKFSDCVVPKDFFKKYN